jgi:hypothetical protein
MTYHLYVNSNGYGSISEYPLNPEIFPEYAYLGEFSAKPDIDGKRYVDGSWVWAGEPVYLTKRRKAYPNTQELIQALWRAMDQGILPKVPGFYDKIDEANKRFPEQ